MLKRSVTIITGGAQGIGKGIARHLLKAGMTVIIADIDREAGQETVQEYKSLGPIEFIHTDVGNEPAVKRCIQKVIRKHKRIRALINNAGLANPGRKTPDKLSLKEWDRVIRTNLTGCFLMAKHAIPYLKKSKGSIVNIASTRAVQSEANTEAYSASKGGIAALTHALSVSLSGKVRVNCISPGWIDVGQWKKKRKQYKLKLTGIDHSQHPAGRVGKPEDIAAMAAYLISDRAGFISGQNFIIDGGMTKKMIYAD